MLVLGDCKLLEGEKTNHEGEPSRPLSKHVGWKFPVVIFGDGVETFP